jgi:hypothetical protein
VPHRRPRRFLPPPPPSPSSSSPRRLLLRSASEPAGEGAGAGAGRSFSLPLCAAVAKQGDSGTPYVAAAPESDAAATYRALAAAVAAEVSRIKGAGAALPAVTYDAATRTFALDGAPRIRAADLRRRWSEPPPPPSRIPAAHGIACPACSSWRRRAGWAARAGPSDTDRCSAGQRAERLLKGRVLRNWPGLTAACRAWVGPGPGARRRRR